MLAGDKETESARVIGKVMTIDEYDEYGEHLSLVRA
jgi:hypothetical protein